MKKLLFILVVAILILPTLACSEPEDFVAYDLSLAGYHLGMSVEEADALRPIQYSGHIGDNQILYARIEQVFIDDLQVDLGLKFRDRRLYMIIVKFWDESIEEVKNRLLTSFGEGEDQSKTFTNFEGVQIDQTVTRWTFPHANMSFVWTSSNKNVASLSLALKKGAIYRLVGNQ